MIYYNNNVVPKADRGTQFSSGNPDRDIMDKFLAGKSTPADYAAAEAIIKRYTDHGTLNPDVLALMNDLKRAKQKHWQALNKSTFIGPTSPIKVADPLGVMNRFVPKPKSEAYQFGSEHVPKGEIIAKEDTKIENVKNDTPPDTKPYEDYLKELSMDEVTDIAKYGAKKNYTPEQIHSMMRIAVEQTELADKYGYKLKIDGLVGEGTRNARLVREKAQNAARAEEVRAAEEISKAVSPVSTTSDIAEAATTPNTIYSPREINKAYRQDRRADGAAMRSARHDQFRTDRLERRELAPEDRREDRILDRQARRNTTRNVRIDNRNQRNDIRDKMLAESKNFPAIDRFRNNIAAQAASFKKGGILYKK